ncbi:MAG TPA: hypothetical protein VFP50_08665 [Anaeromyxobacteraceae bacterium]|nr:hypothetical protein [Anaeromyxobacteraceae bacterium]
MRPSLLRLEVLDRWSVVRAHPRVRRTRARLRLHAKTILAVTLVAGIVAMVIHWS